MIYQPQATMPTFISFMGVNAFNMFGFGAVNYVKCAETFPLEVRTSFTGIASGIGKVGAFVGIIAFEWGIDSYGIGATLIGSAVVMGFTFVFTLIFCPEDDDHELDNDDKESKPLIVEASEGT